MAEVNSAVDTFAHVTFLDENNGREILKGSSVVIDALDNNEAEGMPLFYAVSWGYPLYTEPSVECSDRSVSFIPLTDRYGRVRTF